MIIDLLYDQNIITFRNNEYIFEKVEKISDLMVDIYMGGQIVIFIAGEVSINGQLMNSSDDIIQFFNN